MTTLKEQILALRAQNYSYAAICKELGCSKSSVSYYLGEDQKSKTLARTYKLRKENPLLMKKDKFLGSGRDARKPIYTKVRDFQDRDEKGNHIIPKPDPNFTWEDLLEKFDGKCYLTGRDIDLYKTSEYHLDHIEPRSKEGPSTLDNCGFACKDANFAKSDMSLEDFKQLCLDVVNHFNLK